MNGTDEKTSQRVATPAGRKKSGRKKTSRKVSARKKAQTKVTSTKKPLYSCARHGYETDASASRESQRHGRAMHLGKSHGGRGTAKHGRSGTAKRRVRPAAHRNNEMTAQRVSVASHVRVGGRSHSISPSKVETLKKGWLHIAADSPPAVADAIVRCVNDLNGLLGK